MTRESQAPKVSLSAMDTLREQAVAIARAGIAGADAGNLVSKAVSNGQIDRLLSKFQPVVLSVGKAAGAMAEAFVDAVGDGGGRGLLACPYRLSGVGKMERFVVGHPVPNEESVRAGHRALELAKNLSEKELLVVLLSGGASAGLSVPSEGISSKEKRITTDALLSSGVSIDGLNCVRKHLSSIKGGLLGVAARGRVLTLAISDVVNPVPDDPTVIGSGPTVPDPTTFGDALRVCCQPQIRDDVPQRVREYLRRGSLGERVETPLPGDIRLEDSVYRIVGTRLDAIEGARQKAIELGFKAIVLDEPVVGEARVAADDYVKTVARRVWDIPRPACVISAGETTVKVIGTGNGGRNQEFALASISSLSRRFSSAVLASVGTDGIDGPTESAGALIDTESFQRSHALDLGRPEDYLDRNDSSGFFARLGDLIHTGPTNTNVGDLQVILVG